MELIKKLSQWLLVLTAGTAFSLSPVMADDDDMDDDGEDSAAETSEPKVDPEEVAKKLTENKKKCLGMWISGNASISTYAYVRRDDSRNRILCMLTLTYGTDCFFSGDFKDQKQLVHLVREGKKVESSEVEEINPEAGGIYVLFTPDTLYVLDFDENRHLRFNKRQ